MSQEAFSRELGISKGSLGFYERNENLPNTDVVLKICSKTGVRLEWLLTGDGPVRAQSDADGEAAGEEMDGGLEGTACLRCARLEDRLDRLEEERRELAAENRRLWKENAGLRERCARFEEREKQGGLLPLVESSQVVCSSKGREKG